MGATERPKQYLRVAGRSILEYCVAPFLRHPRIAGVVVVVAPEDPYWAQLPLAKDPAIRRAPGGAQRCQSVLNGLRLLTSPSEGSGPGEDLASEDDWVLVHDAARPLLRSKELELLVECCSSHPVGGLLALPVRDTLKRSENEREVAVTVSREDLWQAQTPQMFRLGALRENLEELLARGLYVGDEAEAMELSGARPLLVHGHPDNIKITYPEDLSLLGQRLGVSAQCV